MKLREFVSQLFGYRIHNSPTAWDDAYRILSKNGTWASAKKQEELILELIKRIEKLEENVRE